MESFGLLAVEERSPAGGPLLDEEETVLQTFERLQLVIGAGTDQGDGTLYITEWRIIWLSSTDPRRGYACHFPTISMHAVAAPSDDACDKPCLYLQLDSGDDAMGMMGGVGVGQLGGEGSDDGGEEGDDEGEDELPPPLPELRLVPADADQLDALFQAFCEGAERNPDESDEDDEEGEGGVFYNQDEVLAGAAAAALGVGDVEELVGQGPPGRFEDADDDEEEAEEEAAAAATVRQNGAC